ncbi:hypothetical protein BC835DRAFT_1411671 [Cytidiella melzeri]|nr:hypothetical protein BC835DRAFT_1411671 [Cytidiella melzeri]
MAYLMHTRSVEPGAHLASSDASAASTVTVTEQAATATSNPYNSGSTNQVSKIVPGILIAFFCFTSLCLAYGLIRSRQRRRQRALQSQLFNPSSAGSELPKPKKKRAKFTKPRLWDVEVKDVRWDADLEALHPVAVELQADPWPQHKTFKSDRDEQKRWFVPGLSRSHKPQEPMQQAQATFMVSMPTPDRRQGVPSREIALGTAVVPYLDDESDYEDDALPKLLDGHAYAYPC